MGALDGIRVLDLTRVLAGPLCTMLLGDLGAEVIKIEQPRRGDDTREWGPPWSGDGNDRQSAYFLSINRNKRSLTLNLKTETGRDIVRRLAAKSHVLIENFKVGQMAAYDLSYESLREMNPALVYCSITGYGQTGPYRDRPGYDYAVQAMSGLMSITGSVDGEPYKVGVAISDVITGLYALAAIQAALRHAEHTGIGQYIDMALLEGQIAALVNVGSNYLISGQIPPRYGNQHPNIVPYQTFHAADGDFVLAVGNDRQFALLCEVINRHDLRDDPRYATNPARVQHRNSLIPILGTIFSQHAVTHWIDVLLAAGIPAAPIHDVAAALEDEHIQARGLVQETTLANGETVRLVGSPLNLSQTPPELRYPPPALGEHSEAILRDVLGLDDAAIAAFRQKGVI